MPLLFLTTSDACSANPVPAKSTSDVVVNLFTADTNPDGGGYPGYVIVVLTKDARRATGGYSVSLDGSQPTCGSQPPASVRFLPTDVFE